MHALSIGMDSTGDDRASPDRPEDLDEVEKDDVGNRGSTHLSLARRLKSIVETLTGDVENAKVSIVESLVQHNSDIDGAVFLNKTVGQLAGVLVEEYASKSRELVALKESESDLRLAADCKAQMVSNLEDLVGTLQEQNEATLQRLRDESQYAGQLVAENQSLRTENVALEVQISKSNDSCETLQCRIEEEKAREDDLARELTDAKKRLAVAVAVETDAGVRREEALRRVSALHVDLKREREHLEAEHAELAALQAQMKTLQSDRSKEAQSLAAQAAELKSRLESTEIERDCERAQVAEEHARVLALQKKLQNAQKQQATEVTRLSQEKDEMCIRLEKLKSEAATLQATLDDAVARNAIVVAQMHAEDEKLNTALRDLAIERLHDKELAAALAEEKRNLIQSRVQAVEASQRRASAITRVADLREKLDSETVKLEAEGRTVRPCYYPRITFAVVLLSAGR